MVLFKQKINWPAIARQVGLLLHVPGFMAVLSMGIALSFGEWEAFAPFTLVAAVGLIAGQTLYHGTKGAKTAHLWDAMVIAGIGWLVCSALAAIPFYYTSKVFLAQGVESRVLEVFSQPTNALFEAFSGFTSTGLTMMQDEGFFPRSLGWWRSLLEWVGGLGLIVFVLALTHLNKGSFQLFYAEAHSEKMTRNMKGTVHGLWMIYLFFTVVGFLLFLVLGMPLWEALNHAMTVISTGGFATTHENFKLYTAPIQVVAMVMMVIGSISFALHFRVLREGNWGALWKSVQHRTLYFLLVGGGFLALLLSRWNGLEGHDFGIFFEWISALTTCGYSTIDFSLIGPMVKLLLVMGMFIGGATGSTVGGLKIRRILYLVSGVALRVLSITTKKERHTTKTKGKEPPGVQLPHSEQSERLFTAEVLFSLWTSTLFLGWFLILKWVPKGKGLDALFEVTSAMSNVGLSSGVVHPDMPTSGKYIFMALMWLGRLEIIPALILLLTLPFIFTRRRSHGKKS